MSINARPVRRFVASGITYEVRQAPPRDAIPATIRLIRMLGPAMAGLISGAGIQLPGGDGLPARLLTWEEIAKGNQVWTFVNLMLARLTYVDADEVAAILDDLCLGNMTITYPGGEPVEIEKVGQLNALVPDVVHLLTLLRYAIEVNARPTSPGSPAGPGQTPTTISDT